MNHKEHKEHKERKEHEELRELKDERYVPLPAETERIIRDVIGTGLAVHKQLGPGFIEPVYQRAMCIELRLRGLRFEQQKSILITYRGEPVCRHQLDLVVDGCVVVEVKAVRKIRPIHQAQILSYLKAGDCRAGLLMNFNVKLFVEGLQRFVR